jgi:hypothetical protein
MFAAMRPAFIFPEKDVLHKLIDSYFIHYNVYSPLLHRPTIELNVRKNVHLRDTGFGELLLAICAIGARYLDDPRTRAPGQPPRAAGWQWFNQICLPCRPLFSQPRLLDVQLYVLAFVFLSATKKFHAVWMMVGIAHRMLLEVGANRRSFYPEKPTYHSELWKRAFWYVHAL